MLRTTTSSGRIASVTSLPGPGLDVELAGEVDVAEAHDAAADHDARQEIGGADEVGDERARRLPVDLGRRADLLDHAVVHHDDAIGHRQRLFLVVRDHDRRDPDALVQAADLGAQIRAHAGIERGQRLVQQQQAGRQRERARHAPRAAAGRRKAAPGTCAPIRASRRAAAARSTRVAISTLGKPRLTRP